MFKFADPQNYEQPNGPGTPMLDRRPITSPARHSLRDTPKPPMPPPLSSAPLSPELQTQADRADKMVDPKGFMDHLQNRWNSIGQTGQNMAMGGAGLAGVGLANMFTRDDEEDKQRGTLSSIWNHPLTGPALTAAGLGLGAYGMSQPGDLAKIKDFILPKQASNELSTGPLTGSPSDNDTEDCDDCGNGTSTLNATGAMLGSPMNVPMTGTMSGQSAISGLPDTQSLGQLAKISSFCFGFMKKCFETGMDKNAAIKAVMYSYSFDDAIKSEWDRVFDSGLMKKAVSPPISTPLPKPAPTFPTAPPPHAADNVPLRPLPPQIQFKASPDKPALPAQEPEPAPGSLMDTQIRPLPQQWTLPEQLPQMPHYEDKGIAKPNTGESLAQPSGAKPLLQEPSVLAEGASPGASGKPALSVNKPGTITQPTKPGFSFGNIGEWWNNLDSSTKWQLGAALGIGGLGMASGMAGGSLGQLGPLLGGLGGIGLAGHALTGKMPWESEFYSGLVNPSTWGQHGMKEPEQISPSNYKPNNEQPGAGLSTGAAVGPASKMMGGGTQPTTQRQGAQPMTQSTNLTPNAQNFVTQVPSILQALRSGKGSEAIDALRKFILNPTEQQQALNTVKGSITPQDEQLLREAAEHYDKFGVASGKVEQLIKMLHSKQPNNQPAPPVP